MPELHDPFTPIVAGASLSPAQEVIAEVRRNTAYPFLLDAKLGDTAAGPMSDTAIASTYDTPFNSVGDKLARIVDTLIRTDEQHGSPLRQVAQRANDVMASAAIVNRHSRRPPLYSESTLTYFVQLELASPAHLPLIRAAGYVSSPPVVPRSRDVDFVIADIAAHMARSDEPQTASQMFEALRHRHDDLANWPQLKPNLFIRRVAGVRPDDLGYYHLDQSWASLMSTQQLVVNTVVRILARDRQPRTTTYLDEEIKRLVAHLLPDGYNTLSAIRNAAYTSDEISWQGLSTFGLSEWETALERQHMSSRRGRTGDLIYAFLMQHGPADIDEIIEHVQQTANTTKRTIQDALNRDPADRFIPLSDRRMAANPIPAANNPDAPSITVIPDERRHQPGTVLHESELLWLTRYVQALNDLTPPLPLRVAITGPRATGFAQGEPIHITLVVDSRHRSGLEPRLADIAATASEMAPAARPNIIITSSQNWARQQAGETALPHHNVWLAPRTSP